MTKPALLFVAAVAAVGVAVPALAHAQTWEELTRAAERLDAAGLPALFWAPTADCDRFGDDMVRRQCVRIRTSRSVASSAKTFVVRGDAVAVASGDWDAARSSVPLSVRGCLACRAPVEIADTPRFIVGRGPVSVEADGVAGGLIYRGFQRFADEAAAREFTDKVVPRLRAELVVRPTAKLETWTQGGQSGYFVDVLGWRVYDPCDGSVLAANPPSQLATVDGSTCERPAGGGGGAAPLQTAAPETPWQLTADEIRRAMQDVNKAVYKCYDAYGVPGRADTFIDVKGDGTVRLVEVRGEFAGTPTGKCITAAVKQAKFPPFQRDAMQIHYPFLMR